jgi:peptidyl-prolyl cis-trans isomerase C
VRFQLAGPIAADEAIQGPGGGCRHTDSTGEKEHARAEAEIENGADFAALAREHSNCPSGGRGGDLGSFGPGMMVPEFDKVVFSAPVNAVQGPVQTQFGYHLIEVTSRDE